MAVEPDGTQVLALAERFGVAQEGLLPALHFEDELTHGSIGDTLEPGPDAAVDGVDIADERDVDLPAQGGDQIREWTYTAVALQHHGAFERLLEQRREDAGAAIDRGGRALFPRHRTFVVL